MTRDFNHPDFPLRKFLLRGQCRSYLVWEKLIGGKHIYFGTVARDPAGEAAWMLHDLEISFWNAGYNPRDAKPRGVTLKAWAWLHLPPAWLLSGPLARFGIAIVEYRPHRKRAICLCLSCGKNFETFLGRQGVSTKHVKTCRAGCTPRAAAELKRVLAMEPEVITTREISRLIKAKSEGWIAAPAMIDESAVAEGVAIATMNKLRVRKPRRNRVRSIIRTEIHQ